MSFLVWMCLMSQERMAQKRGVLPSSVCMFKISKQFSLFSKQSTRNSRTLKWPQWLAQCSTVQKWPSFETSSVAEYYCSYSRRWSSSMRPCVEQLYNYIFSLIECCLVINLSRRAAAFSSEQSGAQSCKTGMSSSAAPGAVPEKDDVLSICDTLAVDSIYLCQVGRSGLCCLWGAVRVFKTG